MTCRYSEIDWRDVLYTAVRQAPGGVVAAARFLTEQRGRSIHAESLRSKLRGREGESISMEMAELLTEWLQDLNRPDALDWLHAFNGRFGLVTAAADDAETLGEGIDAVLGAHIAITIQGGVFAQEMSSALADRHISPQEAEAIEAAGRKKQRKIEKAILAAKRAAGVSA